MPAVDRNPLPITDLLDWSDRDKSLLLSVLTGLLMLGFLGWLLLTVNYTRFGEQFLSVEGAGLARDIFLFNVIGWLLLTCWGIALHKAKRHSVAYPNVCIHFFGFSFGFLYRLFAFFTIRSSFFFRFRFLRREIITISPNMPFNFRISFKSHNF